MTEKIGKYLRKTIKMVQPIWSCLLSLDIIDSKLPFCSIISSQSTSSSARGEIFSDVEKIREDQAIYWQEGPYPDKHGIYVVHGGKNKDVMALMDGESGRSQQVAVKRNLGF